MQYNVDKIKLQQQCEQFAKIERNVQVRHSLVLATGSNLLQLDLIFLAFIIMQRDLLRHLAKWSFICPLPITGALNTAILAASQDPLSTLLCYISLLSGL